MMRIPRVAIALQFSLSAACAPSAPPSVPPPEAVSAVTPYVGCWVLQTPPVPYFATEKGAMIMELDTVKQQASGAGQQVQAYFGGTLWRAGPATKTIDGPLTWTVKGDSVHVGLMGGYGWAFSGNESYLTGSLSEHFDMGPPSEQVIGPASAARTL